MSGLSFAAISALSLWCIGMVAYHLYSGKVVGRGGWVRARDKNPGLYWFEIAIEIVFSAVMIGLVIHHVLSRS